ncbi:MAG: ATP-binding cassette domain-containing protein [Chitinophagales bacterium]
MIESLEADGIQLEFGLRKILSDIYLKFTRGAVTALVGRNGEGKSCLMKIIYGTLSVADKSVRFDGQRINSPCNRRGLLQYLPQFNFIPGHLSLNRIFSDFDVDFSALEKWFPKPGLSSSDKLNELSGGFRRLVELFVILKSASQFVMLDEPFTHLMPIHIEKIKELLIEQKKFKGILISDHKFEEVLDISDHIYLLADGKTRRIHGSDDLIKYGYLVR